MNNIDFLSILFFIIGVYYVIKNIGYFVKPQLLEDYIKKNPKAKIFRDKFWVEKSIKYSRICLIPIGTLIWIMFVWYGFLYWILPLINNY